MPRASFAIGTVRIRPGQARALELPVTRLVTGADISLPVRVVHGREDGPTVWLDAAIHGDEVVGVEVVRQVMGDLNPQTFRGTLIAVPIDDEVRLSPWLSRRHHPPFAALSSTCTGNLSVFWLIYRLGGEKARGLRSDHRRTSFVVMPGLDQGIHRETLRSKRMDCRVKPGNDGLVGARLAGTRARRTISAE